MPNYRRLYIEGGAYFFTVVTYERRPLFADEDTVLQLKQAFRHVKAQLPFVMEAIVVLPDHFHAVWRLPPGDSDYSERWRRIKYRFSLQFEGLSSCSSSRRRRREKRVWQRRFWEHILRDEEDYRRHLDYIHYNPVKHGYAVAPREWPYSSFRRFVQWGVYSPDWGESMPHSLQGLELE
ncbi:protein of unknown function DUF1568 [Nitrosococcus halophilus Nc 4]|uniref:Transposase IS200-like domain-containing protein n=1 Tax=Nitrosococcus halophilus (strain Nc4) TaxID=472759 RepID=D5BXZ1_NITHN|nr:transposase [Nitrosococcus halophilus]ADE15902.1 protein of unknown function DUF1568 [Nitrosococcus halophilus Nc 4]